MPFAKVSQDFFYKVSHKNPSPALPILLAAFIKLFSSIADFGFYPKILTLPFKNAFVICLDYPFVSLSLLINKPITSYKSPTIP